MSLQYPCTTVQFAKYYKLDRPHISYKLRNLNIPLTKGKYIITKDIAKQIIKVKSKKYDSITKDLFKEEVLLVPEVVYVTRTIHIYESKLNFM